MSKRTVDGILAEYRDSLGTSRMRAADRPTAAPIRPTSRIRWGRTAIAAPCVLAAGLSLLVLLSPKDAGAVRYREMSLAIKNAQSMVVRSYKWRAGSKPWSEYFRQYYRDGMWRYIEAEHSPLEESGVIRDGMALIDIKACDHATLETLKKLGGEEYLAMSVDGLEFAKLVSNTGEIGTERAIKIKKHAPVAGRDTYVLSMTRPPDAGSGLSYDGEILIDRATNLPIEAEVLTRGMGGYRDRDRWTFEFNAQLDNHLFDLHASKPVLNLAEAERDLTKRWSKSLFDVDGLSVRDASVSADGTIWIAYSRRSGSRALPMKVVASSGQTYLRSLEMEPSNCWQTDERYQFHGDSVKVVAFVPLRYGGAKPDSVSVSFSASVDGTYRPDKRSERGPVAKLNLTHCSTVLPDYFPALSLDHFAPQIPINLWLTRAYEEKKAGDPAVAARDFEEVAKSERHFIRYLGEPDLQEAVRLYRKAHLESEAARAHEALVALRAELAKQRG